MVVDLHADGARNGSRSRDQTAGGDGAGGSGAGSVAVVSCAPRRSHLSILSTLGFGSRKPARHSVQSGHGGCNECDGCDASRAMSARNSSACLIRYGAAPEPAAGPDRRPPGKTTTSSSPRRRQSCPAKPPAAPAATLQRREGCAGCRAPPCWPDVVAGLPDRPQGCHR